MIYRKFTCNVVILEMRALQGVQECSILCFRKILKISNHNDPNYNTCNRMFDMCSSYCENFIYISLSIAM